MIVHLIDGTYELFRQFYGRRHFSKGKDERFGAVSGVLHSILEMIETGATHVGVATDHVIESFRNDLWPDYRSEEHTSELQSRQYLVCRLLLEKKKKKYIDTLHYKITPHLTLI